MPKEFKSLSFKDSRGGRKKLEKTLERWSQALEDSQPAPVSAPVVATVPQEPSGGENSPVETDPAADEEKRTREELAFYSGFGGVEIKQAR